MSEANGKELYTSHSQEHVKQYVELDGQGRPYKVYTAALAHQVGQPCEVTIYGYQGNSTNVIARKETRAEWTQVFEDAVDLLV